MSQLSLGTAVKPRHGDQMRAAMRARHMSSRTEEAYLGWAKRYYLFHGRRDPATMGKAEIEQFLTWLAVNRRVSASSQNQALAALLFLYKTVLGCDPGLLRARRPERLPVVLNRQEVHNLLSVVDGVPWLMAMVLYGSGLRLMECLLLRVKDIDFTRHEVLVRQGKGNKDKSDDALRGCGTKAGGASARRSSTARRRSGGWLWPCVSAGRFGTQVLERQP